VILLVLLDPLWRSSDCSVDITPLRTWLDHVQSKERRPLQDAVECKYRRSLHLHRNSIAVSENCQELEFGWMKEQPMALRQEVTPSRRSPNSSNVPCRATMTDCGFSARIPEPATSDCRRQLSTQRATHRFSVLRLHARCYYSAIQSRVSLLRPLHSDR
jgi:hypothetical protein